MNLMKWLRKNNTKLMAIVVIVLMVAFIGGSSFRYLFQGSGGAKQAFAYYDHNRKITHRDRMEADQEIEILQALGAEGILRAQDLRGLLLSQLVFRQNQGAATLDMVRQVVQRNRYRISDEQLSQIFTDHTVTPDVFWILLCNEAQTAGIHIDNDEVGRLLERLIPQLFDQRPYGQVIMSVMNRFSVPEQKILTTFGKLLAVLQYSQVISSMENVTASQIRHMAADEAQSLNAQFVQFKASYFADKNKAPSEQAQQKQFEQYKDNYPGEFSKDNPYGFGYRLPNRVQFDYVAVKLPDVAAITKAPTQEEAEQYYQQNRERQFTEKVPSDPNDPNSPTVDRAKSYADVSDSIMNQLRRQRILNKAEQILQEAKNAADANLPISAADGQGPTVEQRRAKAGDYVKIAQNLGKKYKIPFYSGRTGMLSATNMQGDKYLRRMFLTAYGYNPVPLAQALFSVKELGDDATILLSMPRTQMYVSVGPVRDPMSTTAPDLTGQIMMIARVVDVAKNTPPTNLDIAYSTKTLGLGEAPDPQNQRFSVKEQVTEDVRALDAWETTKSRAEEFMAAATKDGWDKAVAQFNKLYGEQAKTDPNDPNVFRVEYQAGLQRISSAQLQVLAAQISNSPAAPIIMNQATVEGQFVDRLFSLIPPKSTSPSQLPSLVEFKPNQSYYVLKNLTLQGLTQEDFQKTKGMLVRREEYSEAQNLAVDYFNPKNILERANFRFANPTDQPGQGETKQKSKEAS